MQSMSDDHQEGKSESEASEGYQIVHRSPLKSLVLVMVVTFSMLINVRALLQAYLILCF